MKRKLAGLREIVIMVDPLQNVADELGIQAYTLAFSAEEALQNRLSAGRLPGLNSCLVGDDANPFIKWMQESINTMLYGEEEGHLVYEHNVLLRPPTAACASSKVTLCAESVRLAWSEHATNPETGDELLMVQFLDVSQVVAPYCLDGQIEHHDLPVLSEACDEV
jgi:hypothetical protein